MADNSIRDQFTEQEENASFYNGIGLPHSSGSQANQYPFYVDSSGDLNFGYGFDISKNGATASILASYLGSAISSADCTH